MKKLDVAYRGGAMATVLAAVGAGVVGVLSLSGEAAARPPGPECGPTRQWVCRHVPCLSCPPIYFEGTICEMQAFEKSHGVSCEPYSGK